MTATDSITPREVADKRSKANLKQAIRMALSVESEAVRHNTQTFNRNRYSATAEIDDYEELKDALRGIKEDAIARLPELIEQLKTVVEGRGGHIYLASTAQEAREYITDICIGHRAKVVVKAKSMTTEEIRLNPALEMAGIEVAETDLAEFILQVADEQPSHIVAPAIHRTRERISQLFRERFDTELPLETGEELTRFARDILREKFLSADVGISGANGIAADSGTLLLVESEGNIRMVTTAPPVHIAVAGIEKVVPSRRALGIQLELLAPSGTGQPLTSYTNIIRPPLRAPAHNFRGEETQQREFHLVLIDNGRMRMREDTTLREALYCVRCSACLNSCANFQAVGGHAFGGETYSGGIGGSWEAGTGAVENARFSELCTGCSRCAPQCPVWIDIPWLNAVLHERLNRREDEEAFSAVYRGLLPAEPADQKSPLVKKVFGNFHIVAAWGSRLAPFSNWMSRSQPVRRLLEKTMGIHHRRPLPQFASQTLETQFSEWEKRQNRESPTNSPGGNVLLLADTFSNYTDPARGMAAVKVLTSLGVSVTLSTVLPEGRSALSQGMISTASARAHRMAEYLLPFIEKDYTVVTVEPSILGLLRRDYQRFLGDDAGFEKIRSHSCDPVEYIEDLFYESGAEPEKYFDTSRFRPGERLFFHGHCQGKTVGAMEAIPRFLRQVGFRVWTSDVECCGMAGSFGYKRDFYDVSMEVGKDLFEGIAVEQAAEGIDAVVASGVSCTDQIREGADLPVYHPMEILEQIFAGETI